MFIINWRDDEKKKMFEPKPFHKSCFPLLCIYGMLLGRQMVPHNISQQCDKVGKDQKRINTAFILF